MKAATRPKTPGSISGNRGVTTNKNHTATATSQEAQKAVAKRLTRGTTPLTTIYIAAAFSAGIRLRVVKESASYSTHHVVLMCGSPLVSPKDQKTA